MEKDYQNENIGNLNMISLEEFDKFAELSKNKPIQYSKRHKIRMNRIFREIARCTFIPFPEVDTIFERGRSKFIVLIKCLFGKFKNK